MADINKTIAHPYDALAKVNLANKEKAKALTRQKFSSEIVKLIDFDTFEQMPTEFIQKDLANVKTDVLYSCRINGKDAYIYFLFEAQSTPDKMMAFRLLIYIVDIMKWHIEQGNNKLPLILPCVLYHGKDSPYPYSRDLADCFEDAELARTRAFKPFDLIDLTIMSEEDITKLPPKLYFEYLLKIARDDDFIDLLIKFLEQHPQYGSYFLDTGEEFLNVVLSFVETRKGATTEKMERLIKVIDNKTDGAFMSIIDVWRKEAKLQGRIEAIEELKPLYTKQGEEVGEHKKAVATAKELLMMGLEADKIAKATKLTKAEVKALSDELKSSKH
jgi:predicted transposase YdaD